MSSYSSRYQSRLLNFISQQSHKVVDKCDRALRHLKFVAEGALQATLYPVYLLVQSARAIGRQIQQVGKKNAAQLEDVVKDESLNYLEADAPIQEVLSFVQDLSLPALITGTTTEEISAVNYRDTVQLNAPKLGEIEQAELPVYKDLIAASADTLAKLEKSSDSGLLALAAAPEISISVKQSYPEGNRPLIVGIATTITTRNLLLVAPENQTLDILTAQQQQELQQKIFSKATEYGQQRQQLLESQLKLSNDLQLVANQADLFSLSRKFWGVMSWVQTSPIAVKVNLFGEINLLSAQRENAQLQISNYQFDNGLGQAASTGFKEFEQLPLPPLPREGKVGRDYQLPIANSSLTSLPRAIAPSEELAKAPAAQYTRPLQKRLSNAGNVPTPQDLIEQFIEFIVSAIASLLGREDQQSEKKLAEHLYAKYKVSAALLPESDTVDRDRTSEEPWLSWSDLFGETTVSPTATNSIEEKINLLARVGAETNYAPSSETLDSHPVSLNAQPAYAQNLSKVNTSSKQTIATSAAIGEQAESSSVKPAPDWWEAQVISRGYVKHPLEQTLEWLDTALLWLEEIGVQLWNWATIQLHKIFRSKN